MTFIERVSREVSLDRIMALIGDTVDIVLTEGYKNTSTAKIEILRSERSQELICNVAELLAIVSDQRLPVKVRQFDINDAVGVADLLVAQMDESLPHK